MITALAFQSERLRPAAPAAALLRDVWSGL
jgi:hypothetical protein